MSATDNDAYRELVDEVHNLGSLVGAMAGVMETFCKVAYLFAWFSEHPETVKGMVTDQTNREWRRIMMELGMEDTPQNREAVSEGLPKLLALLQGKGDES